MMWALHLMVVSDGDDDDNGEDNGLDCWWMEDEW